MKDKSWTLEQGIDFIKHLEPHLFPYYHAALAGSVLLYGKSTKDLDIIVFPHKSNHFNHQEVRECLKKAGLFQRANNISVWTDWSNRGISESRWVEVWDYQGKRVDILDVQRKPYVGQT